MCSSRESRRRAEVRRTNSVTDFKNDSRAQRKLVETYLLNAFLSGRFPRPRYGSIFVPPAANTSDVYGRTFVIARSKSVAFDGESSTSSYIFKRPITETTRRRGVFSTTLFFSTRLIDECTNDVFPKAVVRYEGQIISITRERVNDGIKIIRKHLINR